MNKKIYTQQDIENAKIEGLYVGGLICFLITIIFLVILRKIFMIYKKLHLFFFFF